MASRRTPMHRREPADRYDRRWIGRLTWREFDVLDLADRIAPQPLTAGIVATQVCHSPLPDSGYRVLHRMTVDDPGALLVIESEGNRGGTLGRAPSLFYRTPLAHQLFHEALALMDERNGDTHS